MVIKKDTQPLHSRLVSVYLLNSMILRVFTLYNLLYSQSNITYSLQPLLCLGRTQNCNDPSLLNNKG